MIGSIIKGGEEKVKCFECGGEMTENSTILHLEKDGQPLIIEGVPAKVCQQCGEEYISGPVAEKIGRILSEEIAPAKTITVPVIKWKVA
jgi:YgiT-type zinc finger domain-containing protein